MKQIIRPTKILSGNNNRKSPKECVTSTGRRKTKIFEQEPILSTPRENVDVKSQDNWSCKLCHVSHGCIKIALGSHLWTRMALFARIVYPKLVGLITRFTRNKAHLQGF